jgi:TolB-like protein/Tfp pilus assembly protein PilF
MGEFQLRNVESPASVYAVSPTWTGVRETKPESGTRIAVLPLRNIGGNRDDEFLADGLTEELISSFSKLPSLKVIARTSVMRFKGSEKTTLEIGKELKAGNVLEGSIRRSGDSLRISVQLVETGTEECLWAGNYDKGVKDALAIQEEIAEDATTALSSRVGVQRGPTSMRSITNSGEAFILYLKGRYRLTRHTQDDVEAASQFFEQAVAVDPRFASAYAMMAQCQMFLGFFGFIPTKEAFERAQPSLNRAIELDSDLDIAHMIMGRLLQDRDWNWPAAEAELRRAIELSPNSAEAHYRYGLLLLTLGRSAEAVAEVKMAEELDPLSVAVNQVAGTVLYYEGRYSDAKESFLRAIEIEPRAALAHTNLGLVYFEEGKLEPAVAEISKALELDPKNYFFRADLCYVFSRAGMVEQARQLLSEAVAAPEAQHVPTEAVAGMCSCVGEKERAMQLLEKAYADHSAYLPSIRVERWFDGIRSEPAFASLIGRLGLG